MVCVVFYLASTYSLVEFSISSLLEHHRGEINTSIWPNNLIYSNIPRKIAKCDFGPIITCLLYGKKVHKPAKTGKFFCQSPIFRNHPRLIDSKPIIFPQRSDKGVHLLKTLWGYKVSVSFVIYKNLTTYRAPLSSVIYKYERPCVFMVYRGALFWKNTLSMIYWLWI